MNNYCTWLKNIPDHIQLSKTSPLYDYLQIIGTYISDGQIVVAKTILTQIMKVFEDYISKNGLTTKLSNDRSAINCYKDYINYGVLSMRNSVICNGSYSSKNVLNKVYPSKSECEKFDSMEMLLSEIGEKKFVKLVVESCLFFDKGIVEDRWDEIIKTQQNYPLPARWSNNNNSYTPRNPSLSNPKKFIKEFKNNNYKQWVDINGGPRGSRKKSENRDVEKLITEYTGYTLAGKGAIIRNYIISHIWGNASDPRYFTNFWNIVLVPAWADFLLPKSTSSVFVPKSVASILTATIMKICDEYYDMSRFTWNTMNMNKPQNINTNDILRNKPNENYSIQIIKKRGGKNKLGAIKREDIHI